MNTNPDQIQTNRLALRAAMERMKALPESNLMHDRYEYTFLGKRLEGAEFLDLDTYDDYFNLRNEGCATYRCVLGWYCHWIGMPIRSMSHLDGDGDHYSVPQSFGMRHFGITAKEFRFLFGPGRQGEGLQDRIDFLNTIIVRDAA